MSGDTHSHASSTDESLVERARGGDEEAFRLLFRRYVANPRRAVDREVTRDRRPATEGLTLAEAGNRMGRSMRAAQKLYGRALAKLTARVLERE